jgi:hypothetical protein
VPSPLSTRHFIRIRREPRKLSRADLYRTIVLQMTLSLPEEAAQWRFDFETEMERLETA